MLIVIEKNQMVNNTSGVTGVSYNKKAKKWTATIKKDNLTIRLGQFLDKNDAIIKRLKAEIKYFGEFAPQKDLFDEYKVGVDE